MKKIKKYGVSENILDNVPIVDSQNGNFNKYKKNGKATTWVFIANNELKYLQQFNIDNSKFSGFITEPYLLYLDHSKKISDQVEILKKSLKNKVVDNLKLKDDFELSLLEQETFDDYLILRINFIVILIMSLESFLNNLIPDLIVFESMNKQEIENKLSIKQKLKDIVPLFKIIHNQKEYERKYSEVLRLNDLRNNFVHLKTRTQSNNMDSYLKDFESILRIDTKKEFGSVFNFIKYVESLKNSS
jgi:hypothetical protein